MSFSHARFFKRAVPFKEMCLKCDYPYNEVDVKPTERSFIGCASVKGKTCNWGLSEEKCPSEKYMSCVIISAFSSDSLWFFLL